jgi:hypothetical protein
MWTTGSVFFFNIKVCGQLISFKITDYIQKNTEKLFDPKLNNIKYQINSN